MPAKPPPAGCPGTPVMERLAAGSQLWRVHTDRYEPVGFNPTARPSVESGGRFDALDGSYSYLYAAADEAGAFAEAFVRNLDYDAVGPRLLPAAAVAGRVVSQLEVRHDLALVSLHGADLQQLGQDEWLTSCDESGYPLTRRWAAAVRAWAPTAAGFVWRAKRDQDRFAYVLFGDRTPTAALYGSRSEPLDRDAGLVRLRQTLRRHRLVIARLR